ncbi:MAG: hypothetical protein Q9187_000340 [Circinaria calcarea]
MSNAQVYLDPDEQKAARYRLFSRAIKITGMSQIAALQPYLQSKLEKTLFKEIDSRSAINGWKSVKIAHVMRELASGMLGVYFFGDKLCWSNLQTMCIRIADSLAAEEPEFASAMLCYYKDVIACMGALQLVPSFMKSIVYSLLTKNGRALQVLFTRLSDVMGPGQCNWDEDENLKPMTLLHNMIEFSKESSYWDPNTLIQAIAGIWFAASHQPWINLHFVFLELCNRPEYVQLLRDEIDSAKSLDYAEITKLPILDSFIKEAVRVNPLDKMSIRRKAIKPFTFSNDGPHLDVGEIACVSGWDLMHNEAKYPNPYEFDGHRFVSAKRPTAAGDPTTIPGDGGMRGTTFTDASKDFPVWGYGSKVCPGRWHGALVLKMAIVHLVARYDFRLDDATVSQKWFWETFQMPYESTRVSFRPRSPPPALGPTSTESLL